MHKMHRHPGEHTGMICFYLRQGIYVLYKVGDDSITK